MQRHHREGTSSLSTASLLQQQLGARGSYSLLGKRKVYLFWPGWMGDDEWMTVIRTILMLQLAQREIEGRQPQHGHPGYP